MKRFLFCSLLLITGFLTCLPADGKTKAVSDSPKKTALRLQKRFFLPKDIYVIPGMETNIYYSNVFRTINLNNFFFVVNCAKGRNDAKRWRYVPSRRDSGKVFNLAIQVRDDETVVAEGSTRIHVVPADAGAGRKISLLMIGDSLTEQYHFPARVHELFAKDKKTKLAMIGSHSRSGKVPTPGGVATEGYGGWSYNVFLNRWRPEVKGPRKYICRSKFLMEKDGKVIFSFKNFLNKYNQGRTPDFITIQLGTNDVFSLLPDQRKWRIRNVINDARKLLKGLRKDAPDAVIGVGFTTFPASQDAFGKFNFAYPGRENAWNFKRNVFDLNLQMAELIGNMKDDKLFVIPMQLNLDCENNYPVETEAVNFHNPKRVIRQCNNVHPAPSGYKQMGDTLYFWLKYHLYRQDLKAGRKTLP